MEQGLKQFLEARTGKLVYPTAQLPQQPTLPVLGYERISTTTTASMDGPALYSPRVEITILASTMASADATADLVRNALHMFSGPWTDGTLVQLAMMVDQRGAFRDYETDSVVAQLDFEIWHN